MQKADKDAGRERTRQTIRIHFDARRSGRAIVDILRKLARPT